jgi:D-glycero-D-manno-heptose 1,7-bisphosphate phosphatase
MILCERCCRNDEPLIIRGIVVCWTQWFCAMSERALFLDRDGVVNEEVDYLHRVDEVRFVDGIFSLCRVAMGLGYRLVVVTNQAGIARGYYSEEDFHALMEWMRDALRREGVELDAIYFCPFHPEHGVGKYKREHEDRKPGAGMLRRGAREFGVELSESVMVGDRCSDVAAANAAGLRQAFLVSGTEIAGCAGEYLAVQSLAEVERWLVERG